MNHSWMQWLGQVAVPTFMLVGLVLLVISGQDAWRVCGSILAGSALVAGTQQSR